MGLRLVSLYLRDLADPGTFLKTFEGGTQFTRDYLLEEVIARQPADIRYILLRAALFDRFNADLCDAVCVDDEPSGIPAFSGAPFIDMVRSSELFTISLDSQGRWFRYHHLFQELLCELLERQVGPEEIEEIHRRASIWFESEGLIDEAIQHAMAAGDGRLAGQAVERHWRATMNEGNWHVVAGWLSKLPHEVIPARPELLLALAFKYLYFFDVLAIPPLLDQVENLTGKDAAEPDFSGEVAMFRGFCAFFMDEGADSVQSLEYALERIPPEDVEFRGLAENMFGLAAQFEGQLERVYRMVTAWIEEPLPRTALQVSNFHWNIAITHYIAGDLDTSALHVARLIKAARPGGIANLEAWGHFLDGLMHLQRGDAEAAITGLKKAGELKYLNHARAAADAAGTLAMAYQVNGQPDLAAEALRDFSDFAMDLGEPFAELARAQAARIAIMNDRIDPALRWLEKTPPPSALGMMSWFIQPCIIRCRVLVAEGSAGSLDEAAKQLRELMDMNRSSHNVSQSVAIMCLLSLTYAAQDRADEALGLLDEVLILAEPGGFIFPFQELGGPMAHLIQNMSLSGASSDFVGRVLTAIEAISNQNTIAGTSVLAAGAMVEPLTCREQEVLELLAKRMRDKEIAERLFVTPQTVNSHTKTLYQKLEVKNRRAAVAKGLEFGLLPRG